MGNREGKGVLGNSDIELDAFKREIDLRQFAVSLGYRCLPASLLGAPRFAGRVRIDSRGNAVFPHFDAAGLCGYEIKNQRFTGFAAGGEKGLWLSHIRTQDRRLVFAESAIDALSHATLFPDAEDQTRYASLGGKPNGKQPGLIQATIARLPERSEIVAAFDADEAGRLLVEMLRVAVSGLVEAGRTGLILQAHLPAQEGDDWNHVLQTDRKAKHFNVTAAELTRSKLGLPQQQPMR